MTPNHEKWMTLAIGLAARGLGNVAPNPAVGCLLIKNDLVVGRGWTQPGGRPHAETVALAQAGADARGAIAYVTLEPCAHQGKTEPCAEALVEAGVASVVIAVEDPDPRVSGRGVEILKAAGVEVMMGVLDTAAREANAGFLAKVQEARPVFTLKSASSIDGKIATNGGDSKWITGSEARQFGHMLRARHDAILVGVNTVLADDPRLDCRIEGLENRSPTPVILDSTLRTPVTSKLVRAANDRGTVIVCKIECTNSPAANDLNDKGVTLVPVSDTWDIAEVSRELAKMGFTRVLVEGGGQVLGSFLKAGFCDELQHFAGGKVIGEEGRSSIGPLELAELKDAPHLTLKEVRQLGADFLATYVKAE